MVEKPSIVFKSIIAKIRSKERDVSQHCQLPRPILTGGVGGRVGKTENCRILRG